MRRRSGAAAISTKSCGVTDDCWPRRNADTAADARAGRQYRFKSSAGRAPRPAGLVFEAFVSLRQTPQDAVGSPATGRENTGGNRLLTVEVGYPTNRATRLQAAWLRFSPRVFGVWPSTDNAPKSVTSSPLRTCARRRGHLCNWADIGCERQAQAQFPS